MMTKTATPATRPPSSAPIPTSKYLCWYCVIKERIVVLVLAQGVAFTVFCVLGGTLDQDFATSAAQSQGY